jgi:hypothetical protein
MRLDMFLAYFFFLIGFATNAFFLGVSFFVFSALIGFVLKGLRGSCLADFKVF